MSCSRDLNPRSVNLNRTSVLRIVAVMTLISFASCKQDAEVSRSGATGDASLPSAGQLASIPLGDLAGAATSRVKSQIPNPYHDDVGATAEGQLLFERMNCAACHGYTLAGGMGPNLTDTYWRYGGAPAQIYNSIFEGRPRGMPAWGEALSQSEIWKITAYIEAHGGAFSASAADLGRQGNLGDQSTAAASSLKGLHNSH